MWVTVSRVCSVANVGIVLYSVLPGASVVPLLSSDDAVVVAVVSFVSKTEVVLSNKLLVVPSDVISVCSVTVGVGLPVFGFVVNSRVISEVCSVVSVKDVSSSVRPVGSGVALLSSTAFVVIVTSSVVKENVLSRDLVVVPSVVISVSSVTVGIELLDS